MKDERKNDLQEKEWKRTSEKEGTKELERQEGINERGNTRRETGQKRR